MGMTLMKKIGDFSSQKEINSNDILKSKEHFEEHVNFEDFLNHVEAGLIAYDDMVVAYYDYLDGGIGSVYVYLNVYRTDNDIQVNYSVATEYNGHIEEKRSIPLGEEEQLLSTLQHTLVSATKEFAKLHSE